MRERGVRCSCGSSRRDPGWHAEDCALERAWGACCDEAADEMPDHHEATYPAGDESFAGWMQKVDAAIEAKVGLVALDLADQPYRDWYEDGLRPTTAAAHALRDEGFTG